MIRRDRSFTWVPNSPWFPPLAEVPPRTPGGDSYPSSWFSVETVEATTSPSEAPVDPASPLIGRSERRTQGDPRNRIRARTQRARISGLPPSFSPTAVIRRFLIRRMLGAPRVLSGVRSGIRYSLQPLPSLPCTPLRTKNFRSDRSTTQRKTLSELPVEFRLLSASRSSASRNPLPLLQREPRSPQG